MGHGLKTLAAVTLSCCGLIASPAHAATANANIGVIILQPITITKTADLDFATIVPAGSASTVVIATSGARTCGSGLVCTGTPSAATFTVSGTLSQIVSVSVPSSVTLSSGAHTMTVTLTSSAQGPLTLLLTNSVSVGGTLAVAANQPDGTYTGTFTATVNYL